MSRRRKIPYSKEFLCTSSLWRAKVSCFRYEFNMKQYIHGKSRYMYKCFKHYLRESTFMYIWISHHFLELIIPRGGAADFQKPLIQVQPSRAKSSAMNRFREQKCDSPRAEKTCVEWISAYPRFRVRWQSVVRVICRQRQRGKRRRAAAGRDGSRRGRTCRQRQRRQ